MYNIEYVEFSLAPKKYVLHFIWHDFTLTQNVSTETSQNHNESMTMFSCDFEASKPIVHNHVANYKGAYIFVSI